MATLDPNNPFQSFILTDKERLQGSLLNYLQIACIKNQIATLAMERINLSFAPENAMRDAELKGHIGALQYLLTLHETAEKEIQEVSVNPN